MAAVKITQSCVCGASITVDGEPDEVRAEIALWRPDHDSCQRDPEKGRQGAYTSTQVASQYNGPPIGFQAPYRPYGA